MLVACRSQLSRRVPASSVIGAYRCKKTGHTTRPRQTVPHSLIESIELVKAFANARFDETIEITVCTGLDPRRPNQQLRGSCVLPHGSGKQAKVAVFATGDKAEEAVAAGAMRVGADDLVEEIKAGKHDYTKILATPNMMPTVAKVARILGPRGLMPNPKQGTLTMDLKGAIENAQKGEITFKADMKGQVFAPLGKVSWPTYKIEENAYALLQKYHELQPSGAKGKYIRASALASTQGKVGVRLNIQEDPFVRHMSIREYPPHLLELGQQLIANSSK